MSASSTVNPHIHHAGPTVAMAPSAAQPREWLRARRDGKSPGKARRRAPASSLAERKSNRLHVAEKYVHGLVHFYDSFQTRLLSEPTYPPPNALRDRRRHPA